MLRKCGRVLIAVISLGYLFVGYVVALLSGEHFLVAAGVFLASVCACACLVWIRFTVAGRRALASNRTADWSGTIAVAALLVAFGTAGFAALSTGLYDVGVGSIKGGPLHGADVPAAAYSYYLWQAADAIPLLKIPGTLNWSLEHPFTDHWHGSLALMFKVLVVVPLLYTAAQLVLGLTTDPEPKTAIQRQANPRRRRPARRSS